MLRKLVIGKHDVAQTSFRKLTKVRHLTGTNHKIVYTACMTDNQQDDQPHLSDDQIAFLNSLYDYAREGKVQALSSVIDQGIPVDLPNHNGDTFLILAAYREQSEVVNALIARDADVNALNKRGQSPLTCAVFMQNEEVSRLLLEAGADPELGAQSARATIAAMELKHMGEFLDTYETQTDDPSPNEQ